MNENLQKNLLEMQQKVLKNLIKYNTDTVFSKNIAFLYFINLKRLKISQI